MQCVHIFIPPCYFHTGYGDLLLLKKLFLFLKITCFENKMIILLVKRLNLWKSFGLNSRDVSKCSQTFKKQLCCTQTGTLTTVLRNKRWENTNQCSTIFLIWADNANLWLLCKFTVFPNPQAPFIFQGKIVHLWTLGPWWLSSLFVSCFITPHWESISSDWYG